MVKLCCNAAVIKRILILALLLSSAPVFAQNSAPWDSLSSYAKEQGVTVKGDLVTFTRLTQPYAPLDVQVVGASIDEARQIKGRFFGMAASSSGIGLDKTLAMTNGFHCQTCGPARVEDLRKDLPEIRLLVQRFSAMPNEVLLLAQWGIPGDFRINSIFHQGSLTQEYTSNQNVFPGAVVKRFDDVSTALKLFGVQQRDLEALLKQMDMVHIIALVRTPDGVRAIRTGVTRSMAGLLFVANKGEIPKPREENNGIRINGFIKEADDVFYFES